MSKCCSWHHPLSAHFPIIHICLSLPSAFPSSELAVSTHPAASRVDLGVRTRTQDHGQRKNNEKYHKLLVPPQLCHCLQRGFHAILYSKLINADQHRPQTWCNSTNHFFLHIKIFIYFLQNVTYISRRGDLTAFYSLAQWVGRLARQ